METIVKNGLNTHVFSLCISALVIILQPFIPLNFLTSSYPQGGYVGIISICSLPLFHLFELVLMLDMQVNAIGKRGKLGAVPCAVLGVLLWAP